jgi:hypothetical protein
MKTKLSLWCMALAFLVGNVAFAQAPMGAGRTVGTVAPDGKIIGTAVGGVRSPMELAAYNEASKSGKLPIATNDASFGISDWLITTINASSFAPLQDGNWSMGFNGEKWHNTGNCAITANLDIPMGALIDGFTSWISDTDAVNDINVALYRANPDGTSTTLGSFTSSGTPGAEYKIYNSLSAPETVDNWHNNYYFIVLICGGTTSATSFKGATVWYHRTISPAPATATFGDVPTTHLFFQYIEALAASGITAGCGGANFCPDAAVTRGQMAVFLAKALGLHFGGYAFGG